MMPEKQPPRDDHGWSPTGGRKWHYFDNEGRSLCRRWGFNTADRQRGNDDSPDNCAECRRRIPGFLATL